MNKALRICLILAVLGGLALSVWRRASPVGTQAQVAPVGALASVAGETWNLGITFEGAPTYSSVIGRLVSDVAAYRSARAVQAATIFPAPATARTVENASFYILSRSGAYAETATLSLLIYNYAGVLQHTVSASSIDLQTTTVGVWTPVTLSANPDDLVISSGEFLAFRFTLSGAAGGDLDIRPIFEVSVY